ncbi:hypothetical protein D3C72_2045860 [compost metagenome]
MTGVQPIKFEEPSRGTAVFHHILDCVGIDHPDQYRPVRRQRGGDRARLAQPAARPAEESHLLGQCRRHHHARGADRGRGQAAEPAVPEDRRRHAAGLHRRATADRR